jgi:hypothetical protein
MLEEGASYEAVSDDEGVERGAAERAGRMRRWPGLRADGLDDAAAAEAVVAAWEEMEVGRALHAHHAQAVFGGHIIALVEQACAFFASRIDMFA